MSTPLRREVWVIEWLVGDRHWLPDWGDPEWDKETAFAKANSLYPLSMSEGTRRVVRYVPEKPKARKAKKGSGK